MIFLFPNGPQRIRHQLQITFFFPHNEGINRQNASETKHDVEADPAMDPENLIEVEPATLLVTPS